MLPLRAFFESLGAAVEWDETQKYADIVYTSDICYIKIKVYMGEKPSAGSECSGEASDMTVTVKSINPEYEDIDICFPVFLTTPAKFKSGRIFISADDFNAVFGIITKKTSSGVKAIFTEESVLHTAKRKSIESELVRLVNEERSKNGLCELKRHNSLDKIASMKSEDKAKLKYAGHKSIKYGSPADMVKNYSTGFRFTGECLAAGQKDAERVFEAWLNSPGHRAIIMGEYAKYIGVGMTFASDENNRIYWALLTCIQVE
jgi:uncharacterized protein YkwD